MTVLLAVAAWLPPPPPMKLPVEQATRCTMFAPDGTRTPLTIKLRPERSYGTPGFWWTISGDPARYPSNLVARNMYGYEMGLSDPSRLGFEAQGWHYGYALFWSQADDHQSLVPTGHLVVQRAKLRADGLGFFESEDVGIGFCKAINMEEAQ